MDFAGGRQFHMLKKVIKSALRKLFGKTPAEISVMIQKGNFKIVSFDIFDTLICRSTSSPQEVFFNIQKKVQGDGGDFQKNRIMAEKLARKHTGCEEVRLSDIYDSFMRLTGVSEKEAFAWKELEIREEYESCHANEKMADIFHDCIKNEIPVILTSDMYLDEAVIKTILKNAGYAGWQKLYLSGRERKTKRKGTLFRLILQETGTEAKELLHIGDHPLSDCWKPARMGIHAVLLKEQ